MSEIRVTYSGLISLIFGFSTLFFQLGFLLIVTRLLIQEDFGTWGWIRSSIVFGFMSHHIISYWVTRETARGISSGITAILSSGIFSIIGVIAFIIISFFTAQQSDAEQGILFFSSILIPAMFLFNLISAINLGWKPQAVAYGNFILGISQISSSFVLLYYFDMGLQGVILAVFIAHVLGILFLAFIGRKKIRNDFNIKFLRKWLKLSWLPMYPQLGTFLRRLDVVVYTIMSGSVVGLSFWATAEMISRVVTQSNNMAKPIYPKLLQGDKFKKHLKENLTLLSYFAIPITGFVILFSKPTMYALSPIYEPAYIITIILAIRTFLQVFSIVFKESLFGIEKVDINEDSTFKEYIKSKLFFMPTLNIIQLGGYVTALVIMLLLFSSNTDTIVIITYWSLILLFSQIPHTVYSYFLVRTNFGSLFVKTRILKYGFACILSTGITYLLMEKFLIYQEGIMKFLPSVLLFLIFGLLCYLGITYIVDSKTRVLAKEVINEIRKRKPNS